MFDNRTHEKWENPFTGEVSTASFWDLFEEALEKAEANLAAFDAEDFDEAAARRITDDKDFSGQPVTASIVSVVDGAAAGAAAGGGVSAAAQDAQDAQPGAAVPGPSTGA